MIVPDMDELSRVNLKRTGLLQCGWLQAGKILQMEQLLLPHLTVGDRV